jgi:two-component system, response regulator PdtaR
MDVHLADGGDGIAAAVEIRRRLGIPPLFVTAQTDPATARRIVLARPLGHVVKPFSAARVAAALAAAGTRTPDGGGT